MPLLNIFLLVDLTGFKNLLGLKLYPAVLSALQFVPFFQPFFNIVVVSLCCASLTPAVYEQLTDKSMQTIFDTATRDKLIQRIALLNENHKPAWGKMNIYQMLKHNTYWNGWMLGSDEHTYKQAFIGKIFGKIALKRMIKDEKPFDKNIPTADQFKVQELQCDLETEKDKWVSLIKSYENYHNPNFVHDFFGKMTREQIGVLVYKHTDHHLRQFNV